MRTSYVLGTSHKGGRRGVSNQLQDMQGESSEEEDLLAGTDHNCFSLSPFPAPGASVQSE